MKFAQQLQKRKTHLVKYQTIKQLWKGKAHLVKYQTIKQLWKGKTHLVKYQTIIGKKINGCLNILDIFLKMHSLRLYM